MGNLLPSPITEMDGEKMTLGAVRVAVSGMQGWRTDMEDAHIVQALPSAPDHFLVGVYDGHGGSATAKFVAANLIAVLESTDQWKQYLSDQTNNYHLIGEALTNTYFLLDAMMITNLANNPSISDHSGCTAVTSIVTPTRIVVANSGDSRAILGYLHPVAHSLDSCSNARPLSTDHKPDLDLELRRIEASGSFVDAGRVNGDLATSRALGDFGYKTHKSSTATPAEFAVTAKPDIESVQMTGEVSALVLACDGIWDVCTNEYVIDEIHRLLAGGETSVEMICQELLTLALEKGSKDNMTIAIALFVSPEVTSLTDTVEIRRGVRKEREEALKRIDLKDEDK